MYSYRRNFSSPFPSLLHILHISIFSVFTTNGEKCVQYSRWDILVVSSIMDDNAPFHRQMGNSPLLQDFFCLHPTDEYSQVFFCSHLWITQQKWTQDRPTSHFISLGLLSPDGTIWAPAPFLQRWSWPFCYSPGGSISIISSCFHLVYIDQIQMCSVSNFPHL